MPKSDSAATDLDLINYLKAIPDARKRRGVRITARNLFLEAVPGILSRFSSLRDLKPLPSATTLFSSRHLSWICGVHPLIQPFATSSAKWT